MNDYCGKCSFWSGGENLKVKQDPDNLQKNFGGKIFAVLSARDSGQVGKLKN